MDVNNIGDAGFDVLSWYLEIPVVSRVYLTSAFLTTAACAVDIISPFSLYFNFNLIFVQGQVWRLLTTFLFFGLFSVDFLFHMYFLVRYSRMLEEGDFRGRTAHFLWMLLFGITMMTIVATYLNVNFLGSSLTFMMLYVWVSGFFSSFNVLFVLWYINLILFCISYDLRPFIYISTPNASVWYGQGRRNEDARMSFLGVLSFTAPYLPWVMLAFSLLIGNSITVDIIGILVGHSYYFLEYIYPVVADIRGWKVKKIMEPPRVLHWLCGTMP